MLPKAYRFKAGELRGFFESSGLKRFKAGFFDVLVGDISDVSVKSKYAVAVSKKKLKRAVDRNRVRRVAYNALNSLGARNARGKGIVLIYKGDSVAKSELLFEDVNKIVEKIKKLD